MVRYICRIMHDNSFKIYFLVNSKVCDRSRIVNTSLQISARKQLSSGIFKFTALVTTQRPECSHFVHLFRGSTLKKEYPSCSKPLGIVLEW